LRTTPTLAFDEHTQEMIDGMIAAEARHLSQRDGERENCDCKDGMFPARAPANRRDFLFAAGSGAGAAAAALLAGPAAAQQAPAGAKHFDVPPDPTKEQGRAVAADGGYGSRSQFETEARMRFPTANENTSWSFTPLDRTLGNLTPSGLHFERHHGGIPTIDPAKHMLYVHGMVDGPRKFTMADLKRFPSVTRKHFIECSGNGLTEWNKPTLKTVQGTHGLLSTSEWTGVQFATIAREVGLKDGGSWVLAEGSDAAVMTRSIPMEKMLKDAILAYGQNGEAIRPEQGYPLRLLLPGYEGNTHIKWLRRLEVSDKPFMTREETSKYTDRARPCAIRRCLDGRRNDLGAGAHRVGGGTDLHGAFQRTLDVERPAGSAAKPMHRRDRLHSADSQAARRHPRLKWAVRLHLPSQCHPELGHCSRRERYQCTRVT